MRVITDPYFLAVCVPTKIDRNGVRWCTELWAKDLERHLEYISELTLASPRTFAEPSDTDRRLDMLPFNRINFVDLPSSTSYLAALMNMPELLTKLWKGIRQSKIVHAGFGGWPVSEGWFVIPIGRLQGKFVISYVESSFWRIGSQNASWRHKLRALILEQVNRFCVKISDLRFFTSKAYEKDFLGERHPAHDHSYVTPASWIDESVVLSEAEALQLWNKKRGTIRLLFAGRLIPEKGLRILFEALDQIDDNIPIEVFIVGDGPLAQECAKFASKKKGGQVRVRLLPAVPYTSFFELIRQFDAVLVPSVSDEQPRLVFDAFSQALPVLGSDTGGIVEVVQDGYNGRIIKAGDPAELAKALRQASQSRNDLKMMGLNALASCRLFTHRAMHAQRSEIIWNELKAVRAIGSAK